MLNSKHQPSRHEAHDELLIARLYGNDVTDDERTLALDQLASCEECATLFADFGAIAAAMPTSAVPARPRDFTLAPADAARLRPRRFGLEGFASWSRPLGGLLSGLAAVALAVVVVNSMGPFGATTGAPFEQRAAAGAQSAQSGGGLAPNFADAGSPAAASKDVGHAAATVAPPESSAAAVVVTTPHATGQTGAFGGPTAAPAAGQATAAALDNGKAAQPNGAPETQGSTAATSGTDLRPVFAVAALLILMLGLGLLVAGTLAGRNRETR